ncbi:MAG: flavin reductase family protein [Desulfurococcaceae archaeon]
MYTSIDPKNYIVLHPRPVYLIVSRNNEGKLNVMAASWVSPVSDEPFLVAVSIWKESLTYQYIREIGEFTINIPSEKHVDIVYRAGTMSGKEIDKISALGLQTSPSKIIRTPGLMDMLGFLECVVKDSIDVGESTLFIAEVKAIHIRPDLFSRYGWDLRKAKVLLHNSGKGFSVPERIIIVKG